ncbi:hypothetical protein AWC38_SpisGene9299 [Stylophora pistillata]|uniref:Uncharacterized protein n=1 Tax=Stylophora pistillata TaxID=50429 RepID=A0A2B4SBP0_STYPI|nr:hypothetical protein AWC38_SpisGene9299 [Stylophora pistillata]
MNRTFSWMFLALVLLSFACWGSTFSPNMNCPSHVCRKRKVARKFSEQQEDYIKAYCDRVRPCNGANEKRSPLRGEAPVERDREQL